MEWSREYIMEDGSQYGVTVWSKHIVHIPHKSYKQVVTHTVALHSETRPFHQVAESGAHGVLKN